MSKPELFRDPIPRSTVERLAQESFEDMLKFVVDIERGVVCAGGGMHSDEEQLLLEDGSRQEHLWGANYYLNDPSDGRFEFTSMINIRPSDGNKSQEIQSETIRQQVRKIALRFFESSR